jgi:vacuolar-type H+-ATPase subunit F/Vma7
MSRIAVIGESPRVDGWALAGALIVRASGPDEVRRAWALLPADVEVVVATPAVAEALGEEVANERLVVILP